jgi:hypothetical protein
MCCRTDLARSNLDAGVLGGLEIDAPDNMELVPGGVVGRKSTFDLAR